jgi:hypothetical protein
VHGAGKRFQAAASEVPRPERAREDACACAFGDPARALPNRPGAPRLLHVHHEGPGHEAEAEAGGGAALGREGRSRREPRREAAQVSTQVVAERSYGLPQVELAAEALEQVF